MTKRRRKSSTKKAAAARDGAAFRLKLPAAARRPLDDLLELEGAALLDAIDLLDDSELAELEGTYIDLLDNSDLPELEGPDLDMDEIDAFLASIRPSAD